ncbi:MAG: hypothetical protein HQK76_10125 [Desulfobacterales bacterium]|nr:hypothetical protein [Desulfobacterales bacterium]
MIKNLPEDFKFVEYETVWKYISSPVYQKDIEIDVFAKAPKDGYSVIVEVKNRDRKFSKEDAEFFIKKAGILIEIEKIEKLVCFVFSIKSNCMVG